MKKKFKGSGTGTTTLEKPEIAASTAHAIATRRDRLGDVLIEHNLATRSQVGEALVECEHVGIRRLGEVGPYPVYDRVRDLVGDDVVRQAGEDCPAGIVLAGVVIGSGEVAEEQRALGRAVARTGRAARRSSGSCPAAPPCAKNG